MHHRVLNWGLSLMLGLVVASATAAPLIAQEEAVETVALQLRLNRDLTGTVSGKSCERCALRRFPVTESTIAIENNNRVDLRRALERNGQPATIMYSLETGNATKIIW